MVAFILPVAMQVVEGDEFLDNFDGMIDNLQHAVADDVDEN